MLVVHMIKQQNYVGFGPVMHIGIEHLSKAESIPKRAGYTGRQTTDAPSDLDTALK